MGTSTDSRGVSSVLATLLLTGIVAITVTASGAAYIDHSLDGSAAGHTVGQVDVSANDTTVDVVHLGGDSFDPDTLEAVLKSETDSVRVPFTDGTIDGGGDFDPASTWHYDYSDTLDGHLTKVYVVYTPKNDVLDVERFENTTESGSGDEGDAGDSSVCPINWSGINEAFLDENENGAYDAGERTFTETELKGGVDADVPLIIPSDVEVSSSDPIRIAASGICLSGSFAGDKQSASVSLDGKGGPVELVGGSLDTAKQGSSISLTGSTVNVRNGSSITAGAQSGAVTLHASSGDVVVSESHVSTAKQGSPIEITGSTITVRDAAIETDAQSSTVTLRASDGAATLQNTTVETRKNDASVTIEGTSVDASETSIATHAQFATVDIGATAGSVAFTGPNSSIETREDVDITATNGITLTDAAVEVRKSGKHVSLMGNSGDIDLTNTTLSATRTGQSTSHQNDLTATVDSGYAVIVDGATFEDDDDKLDVEPDGASTDTAKTT